MITLTNERACDIPQGLAYLEDLGESNKGVNVDPDRLQLHDGKHWGQRHLHLAKQRPQTFRSQA